ncbi:hypothetical protein T484DRAFT_1809180 [Baffinella frigidus]|nr:hypothetical protein T484DRAFT_1809180 [Cryptophyta sp. CCMP2293]
MQDKGQLLVDGGYVNNLPADVMIKIGVHTVIGVDVETKQDNFENLLPIGESLSGWFVLWRTVVELLGLGGKLRLPKYSTINAALNYT